MTHDTTKVELACEAFLAWIADAKRGLERFNRSREEMRSVIDGIKAVRYDRDGAGAPMLHGDDRMAEVLSKLDDIDRRIESYTLEYAAAKAEWTDVSARMPQLEAQALELHYIDGLNWDDVAERISYSARSIYYIRLDALYDLYELLPQGWR